MTRILATGDERFVSKIVTDNTTGCWLWQGALKLGYGWFHIKPRPDLAHRIAYRMWVGPIPSGLTIDHLCHTRDAHCRGGECIHRRCVNPEHLEVVTLSENKRRGRSGPALNAQKTHCVRGHAYDTENTHYTVEGWRQCRACWRERRLAA